MKFIDLFAGIGGFRSGLEKAGHQCIGYIEWDKFARQSYEAIYDTDGEFTAHDIQEVKGEQLPNAELWTFGSPCTNISIAGNRIGIRGGQSRMFFEVIRLLKERAENQKTLPTYLIMENVKNLLSSNQGRDFAEVIYQMDKVGYDIEWNVFDSAEVVPQHRERIYIIGHFRKECTRQVFPIIRKGTKNTLPIKEVAKINNNRNSSDSNSILDISGISHALTTMQGGGREPKILVKNNRVDMVIGSTQKNAAVTDGTYSPTLTSAMGMGGGQTPLIVAHSNHHDAQGDEHKPKIIVKACLTPNRIKKRQNGRRFKENNEPAFTLTVADRNGVLLDDGNTVAIRKLTPRECWRLQGFTDEQFDKAKKAGVSNSQLYKQAGNAVTVPVVEAIGKKLAENESKMMREGKSTKH